MKKQDFIIRKAKKKDVVAIIKTEKRGWGNTEVETYNEKYFNVWLETNPGGFWVSIYKGELVGYLYFQYIYFDLKNIFNLEKLRSYDFITDNGFTKKTHIPGGNCVFGCSLCSIERGAGRLLTEKWLECTKKYNKEFALGSGRISGFAQYLKKIKEGNIFQQITPKLEEKIALWYSIETVKMVNGNIYAQAPDQPDLDIPKLEHPDPVLGNYMRNRKLYFCGILPNFFSDPQSLNYSVFGIYKP